MRSRLVALIGLAALAGSAMAEASSERAALPVPESSRPALRVATYVHPPWLYYTPNCVMTGIAYENLESLAGKVGVDIEAVFVAPNATEADLLAQRIDIAFVHPLLNGPLNAMTPLSFGMTVDVVLMGRAVHDGRAPTITPALRVGVRNADVAKAVGLDGATLLFEEQVADLVAAYRRGDIDLIAGHREVFFFAMVGSGGTAADVNQQPLVKGRYDVNLHLSPQAERQFGATLREPEVEREWNARDIQLRRRYMTVETARAVGDQSRCIAAAKQGH